MTPNFQTSRVAAPVCRYWHCRCCWCMHPFQNDSQQTLAQFPAASYAKLIDHCCMQTIRDGKSIIIEGLHLDPGLYLYEFGKYGIRHLHTRSDSLVPSQASARQGDAVLVEPVNPEPINPDAAVQQGAELEPNSRYSCSAGSHCTCHFIKTCSQ
jgi:hypothetical protein